LFLAVYAAAAAAGQTRLACLPLVLAEWVRQVASGDLTPKAAALKGETNSGIDPVLSFGI
jgi:hypothetical protein